MIRAQELDVLVFDVIPHLDGGGGKQAAQADDAAEMNNEKLPVEELVLEMGRANEDVPICAIASHQQIQDVGDKLAQEEVVPA